MAKKEKQQLYYQDNKTKINKRNDLYYQLNTEKIHAQRKEQRLKKAQQKGALANANSNLTK